jgi:hypothetical protein
MIPAKFKPVLYGLSVFAVYAILTLILRFAFDRMPEDAEFLGLYTTNDLLLGLVVAVVLTVSHERKKRLK